MEDLLTDVSFVRWIRGEASSEEEKNWEIWLQEDSEHERLVEEAKTLITAFQEEECEIPDTRSEWQKLDASADREERQTEFIRLSNDRHQLQKSRRLVAASILLLCVCLGAFLIYQYQPFEGVGEENLTKSPHVQEYKTDYGEKAIFRLSDDSRIVLNANSHIQFSSAGNNKTNTTEVWLQGEAYFDITHLMGDRQRTFTVHTDDGSVQVLGTRFAVKTFEGETRTVLEEGKILVQVTSPTGQTGLSGQLSSGQPDVDMTGTVLESGNMATFSTGDERVAVEKVNPRVYTSWYEDVWFFEDTPIKEIMGRIEDTFGVEVNIPKELADRKLSGSVKSTNLKVLTEALSKILDITIKQQDQALYIGTGE